MIQFGYYPWILKFRVPNTLGYPRVIPKKTQNLELYGYPTRKYPWNSDTNPNQPIPEFCFGFGYYPWVPKFWVPNPRSSRNVGNVVGWVIWSGMPFVTNKENNRKVNWPIDPLIPTPLDVIQMYFDFPCVCEASTFIVHTYTLGWPMLLRITTIY